MIYELRLCIVCTLERLFQVADQTKPLEYIFSKIGSVPRDSCVQGSKMGESINFRVRGIILLAVGFIILIAGVSLHFELNTGTSFPSAVLGCSIPFFFIGGLLLRAHIKVKNGQPPFGW